MMTVDYMTTVELLWNFWHDQYIFIMLISSEFYDNERMSCDAWLSKKLSKVTCSLFG